MIDQIPKLGKLFFVNCAILFECPLKKKSRRFGPVWECL